ncbi:MAG: CAP domain-containing protein [Roseiflexus sp.]
MQRITTPFIVCAVFCLMLVSGAPSAAQDPDPARLPPPVVADQTPGEPFLEPTQAFVAVPQSGEDRVYLPLIVRPDPYPPVNRDMELEFIRLLNEERVRNGLNPLSEHPRLTLAARRHAYDLGINLIPNGICSHTGSDGSRPGDRANWAGYPEWQGEAAGCGVSTAADALQGALNSPPHRGILLNPEIVAVGVGIHPVVAGPYAGRFAFVVLTGAVP